MQVVGKMGDALQKYYDLYIPEEVQTYLEPSIYAILFVSGSAILFTIFNRVRMHLKVKRAMRDARSKRAEQLKCLKQRLQNSGLTLEMRNKILSLDIVNLQKFLKDRSLKAIDVLRAYQFKALEAQEKINCIVAIIPDAEELALKCDAQPSVTKPLHGIPISLKETIFHKGLRMTWGLGSSLLYPPATEDSNLVKCLKELGAIPFVTTNVPQAMLTIACDNNIYGQTLNPHKADRCPGGSSGGEAALIGFGGSILGIGTDLGGSIRAPAHFCGVFGFKTTVNRFGTGSTCNAFKDQILIENSIGPMSQTADGLVITAKALFSPEVFEMDHKIIPVEFQNHLFEDTRKLRIGYYVTDNVVHATPACQRAVLLAKKALEARGHTVVEFTPPRILDALCITMHILWSDGHVLRRIIKHEKPCKEMFLARTCEGFNRILSLFAYPFDKTSSRLIRTMDGLQNYRDIYNLVNEKEKYNEEFANAMQKDNLDALICPVMASPSFLLSCPNFGRFPSYPLLYNLLNYPVVSMPITKVSEEDVNEKYNARTLPEFCLKGSIPGSVGLPVNIQVVAPIYKDELVLRVVKEIDSELKVISTSV
ncbi:fatty acid amide hydrolase 1 isoform X1 [Octopus sinensis]|uniref:fatty acid amide hydrolase n=2 Tax=Octopus sinensis TaxID=2607531 RepID=A0A6P7SMN9_9MOLL|nr:fatty acid amide hydrolase 1 isoform X1 [Octopus sinensis]